MPSAAPQPAPPAPELGAARRVRRRRSIVLSVLAVLCFVALVPVSLMGWQVIRQQTDELVTTQKEEQLDKANELAREISSYAEEHFGRAETIADALSNLAESAGDPASREARVRSLLERYVAPQRGVLELRVATAAGSEGETSIHTQSFDPAAIGEDLEPRIQEAVDKGRRGSRSLSNPFLPKSRPLHPLAVLGVPLRAIGGEAEGARGVLVAVISMSPIQALVRSLGDADGAYTVFVLDDGPQPLPFAHTDFFQVVERADLSANPLVQDFMRYGMSSMVLEFSAGEGGDARGVVGSYAPISVNLDDHRWGVFVQVDSTAGLYKVHEMRKTALRWGLVAFVLAVVIGVVFSWRLTGPIHQLAESSRRVASGEYGRRVTVRSNNELGMLADNFNLMSEEIRHTIDDLKTQKELNDQLFISSIRSLAAAIDARDPYTRGHSERVRRFSRIIARQMDLPPEQIRSIEIGALLHDVGKIGIEDRILRKPAALTPEEFEIMKTHPEKGGDIMEPISFLREASEIIVHHHERYDGNGYPSGLRGEEIPFGARVVNVADTFDAMTTNRPYQRAMTFAVAARKISEFAGKACDPDVVKAFQAAMALGLFGQVAGEEKRAG